MTDKQFYMLMYIIIVVISGVGEFFRLVPVGTLSVVLGTVLGHSLGTVLNSNKTPPPQNGSTT